jgi:hypothetical protein
MEYPDIIEKVQSRFIRKLLHLDFKTPTSALRLETDLVKLKYFVLKQQLNFVIRILQLEPSRLTRLCYNALKLTTHNDSRRYNWIAGFYNEMKKMGLEHLGNSEDYLEVIRDKQKVLERFTQSSTADDITRARESMHFQYCADLVEGNRLKDLISDIGLSHTRTIAQLRLNKGCFCRKGEKYELTNEICTICNSDSPEDAFHLVMECRIHRSSQLRFCHHLQLQSDISRLNFHDKIIALPSNELKKLSIYTTTALKRRKLFLTLADY